MHACASHVDNQKPIKVKVICSVYCEHVQLYIHVLDGLTIRCTLALVT